MRFFNSCLGLVAICFIVSPLVCGAKEPAVRSDVSWVSFTVPGAFLTIAQAINDSNVVIGSYNYQYGAFEGGFIRSADGVLSTFSVANSETTFPVAIDAAGDIAGQYFDGHVFVGFLRKADGTVDTFIPRADDETYVTGINADATVVGYFSGKTNTSPVYAYLRRVDGELIRFHVNGSMATVPEGIDAAGEVTGYYSITPGTNDYASFVRTCDGVIHTFAVPGYFQTMPVGIDPQGTILGVLTSADANYGFLRSPAGAITKFGIPGIPLIPQSINASGAVTGYFFPSPDVNISQAFLRSTTGTYTFFDFPGGTETYATSINSSGVITGNYTNGFGAQSFLRIPRTDK